MRIAGVATFLGLMLCMFASASHAQSVQTDFDKSYNFSKLKTFNFAAQTRRPNDPLAQDQLNDGRIKTALEAKLSASGFRMENAATPDFVVAYHVTTKNGVNVQDYSMGPRWFGRRDIRLDQYTEGTLTVDIIDVATKQLVWRGNAAGTIELKGIEKKVDKAVDKLVARFIKDTKKKEVQG